MDERPPIPYLERGTGSTSPVYGTWHEVIGIRPEQLSPVLPLPLPLHQPCGLLGYGWALDCTRCYLYGPLQLPVSAALS